MSDTLLRVEDLKIYYPVAGSGFGKKEFVKAVDGVTFEVKKGEVFGIVGEAANFFRSSVPPAAENPHWEEASANWKI